MRKRLLLGGVVIAGIATAMVVGQQAQREQPGQAGQQERGTQLGQQPGQAGQTGQADRMSGADVDKHFVECAAKNNLMEIELGQIVTDRVEDPQVKQFAQRLVQEHKQSQTRLKQIAQQSNLQVPDKLEQWQQAKIDAVKSMDPQQLAVDYAFHQVGCHHVALLNFQRATTRGQSPEIKQFASQGIPDLQSHLREANQIAMKYSGGRSIAGEAVGPAGQRPGQQGQIGQEERQQSQQRQPDRSQQQQQQQR